jgi:hypothetical protein
MKNVIGLIFCGLCIYWAADWAANRESRVPILDSPKAIDPHEQPTEPKAILTPHEQRLADLRQQRENLVSQHSSIQFRLKMLVDTLGPQVLVYPEQQNKVQELRALHTQIDRLDEAIAAEMQSGETQTVDDDVTAPEPSRNGQDRCLSYGQATVKIRGTMEPQTFPGPPNYESVAKGDSAENVWVLNLDAPICTVRADQDQPAEANIKTMQLTFAYADMYNEYRSLVGKHVTVTGGLWHASTGHHHTSVMLQVKDIEP